jgi:trehalose 6-phosphate phosphatase
MRHLFRQKGRAALAAALAGRPLLAFDFDGTLAPLVTRPADARVAPALSRSLAELARLRPVAVITGRSIDDVAARLGFEPRYIVGNHGAEDRAGGNAHDAAALDGLRRRLAAASRALRAAGVDVEDKTYSIALHYRRTPDVAAAQRCIEALLRDLDPALHFFGGKSIVNVVVAGAPDKGDALVALLARAQADVAIFVGDDVNDESAFARAQPGWVTVRIGRDDPLSHAEFFLDGHAEVATLVRIMLDVLGQQDAR